MKDSSNILAFLHQSEKLKTVLRHAWLSSDRQESVAEHTWRMMLMALVLHRHLDESVNLERVLKICLVHDLAESVTGDSPAFLEQSKDKSGQEATALDEMTTLLDEEGDEIRTLWREYEDCQTPEARFAKALDKLEVVIQHTEADIKWHRKEEIQFNLHHGDAYCEYDTYLKKLRQQVRDETIAYYKRNGVDPSLYATTRD